MTTEAVAPPATVQGPWYRSLTRQQWNVLVATNLGWLFDGFENYALILTAGPALRQLLDPSLHGQIPFYIGAIIGINLLGWGIGGMLGGIAADYFGRKRVMIVSIIAYSVLTGASAFSFSWISFAVSRFMVGVAVGSEWATGSSMIAELWPDHARGKGAGLMQCGLGIGFFVASLVWLFVAPLGPDSWRYMFLIGVLPALLTLWIRRAIPESKLWEETSRKRQAAQDRRKAGSALSETDANLVRFTLFDLFADAGSRKRTIIVFLMSLTTTVGFWSISTWVPPFVGSLATGQGLNAAQWASYAGMAYTAGSITGYVSLGFLADRFGRKPVTMFYFAAAFLMTPVLFLWTSDLTLLLVAAAVNAFFTLGQYSWMAVWLPELFPTRSRATGLAFTFNAPRFIAFLGPLFAGMLIVQFGGFSHAAMTIACIYVLGFCAVPFLPETKGKPLPA
jgi:MFS family permease